MGKYHVAAPDGREFEIEGDAPPSESDLEQIFGAQTDKPAEPTAGDALDAVFQNSLKTGARIPSDAARSLMDAAVNNAKYPAYQMPEGVGQGVVRRIGESKPVQLLSRPLLDLAPSSESIRSVITLPFQLAQERAENTPDNQSSPIAENVMAATPSDKALAVATGATRAVGDMASFFTSPIGIATLGMGALPATAQKGIALAFAAQMASDLPDTANELMSELQKPEDQRDYEKISKLATGGAASTILTGIGMKHGMAETPAKSFSSEINLEKQGAPNAETVSSDKAVNDETGKESQTSQDIIGQNLQQLASKPSEPMEQGVTPSPSAAVPEKVTSLPAPALEAAQEIGFQAKRNDAAGMNTEGMPPEMVSAIREKHGPQIEFTDKRPDSPHPGMTFYMPEDATKEQIVARYQEKAKEFSNVTAPKTVAGTPIEKSAPSPTGKGIAASVRAKWATATEQPLGSEAGFINIDPLKDLVEGIGRGVKASIEAVRAAGKEAFDPRKMNDYRRSVLWWSAKLERSYQESYDAAREIRRVAPKEVDQEGMTNWLQAGGDKALLASRMAATTDKKLKAGYRAALNLTPEQIAVATDARKAYDALHSRGMFYDIIKSFKDNYVTQIWDLKKGPTGGASSRTLRDRFRFSKASTFDSFFDGEQAGYKPKTKSLAKLLPIYIHEMNSVIAARQLVADMSKGVASDGRPLVVPRGAGVSVDDGAGNKATLITPKTIKGDTGDYKTLDAQPAMNGWRWASKDSDGKPVFLKSDLAIHPEAYGKLKNVLGKSAITEWYQSKGSASSAIPKGIVKLLDVGQGEVKRTMLGLFAPFHQVQEGTHAVGHRVNPFFNIPHIDLVNNPAHMDAAKHGLMLQPDRASQSTFMEGFRHSGLVSRIPGIGPAADWYSHYLFHEYIPGLKYKTYEAILGRNQSVFEKELKSGAVKAEDVKLLSAEQANAAYGHLNYADLARNPTMQHIFRLGLLAPDFLEARARFTGQAIKGATSAKVGREQLLALATLAIAQAAGAYIGAKTTDGEWDWKNPFSFTKGNRRYTLRSVPEDTYRLLTDTRAFVYARLNPIIGKGAIQYISGVDWRGQKRTALETTKELAQQPIPLTVKGFLGIGNTPLSEWEQLAGAVGLKISRYSAQSDVYKMVDEFKKNSKDPKLVAEFERHQQETSAPSDYKPLRDALEKDDFKVAKEEYAKLLATKKADLINRAMQPYTVSKIAGTDYWQKHDKPFSGGKLTEQKFVKSLSAEDKQVYERAKAERLEQYKKFQQMLKSR